MRLSGGDSALKFDGQLFLKASEHLGNLSLSLQIFNIIFLLCVYVCGCMCTCVCMCNHLWEHDPRCAGVCMEARGECSGMGSSLSCPFHSGKDVRSGLYSRHFAYCPFSGSGCILHSIFTSL